MPAAQARPAGTLTSAGRGRGLTLALTAVLLLIGGANAWHSASRFFTSLTEGLTGLLAALTVALLAGGYATVRHVTV